MKLKRVLNTLSFTLLALGAISFGASAHIQNKKDSVQEAQASSATYWSSISQSAISEAGETLMNALKTKISNNVKTLGYGDLWTAYKTTDIVPGTTSKIWDMYGGFQFTYGTDQAGSYSKEGDVYNREHSVPKSWFNEASPMYSDLVHLIPTDGKVNGMRSNYALGEVSSASYSYKLEERYDGNHNLIQTEGYSKLGTPKSISGVSCTASKVFEPDDQYKGDLARIYMYFATRYAGVAASGDGAYNFKDSFPYLSSYGLAMIKKWHVQDPVSQKELDRNDGIETVQGNRNPFVDHPEWGDDIFGSNYEETHGGGSSSDSLTITASSTSIETGDTVNLSASISSGTSRNLQWYLYADGSSYGTLTSTSGYSSSFVASSDGTVTIGCKTVDNESPYLSNSVTITIGDSGGDDPGGGGGEAATGTGTINFGTATGSTNVNASSVSGDDSLGNTWTVTTAGTTSFTPNASYSQIGSSSKPATAITFTTTLSSSAKITAFSAKFGGFSDTAGTVTLKVGDTTIGNGSLNASSDVTITNSSSATGSALTVTVSSISKGVKAYYISYTAESSSSKTMTSISLDGYESNFTYGDEFDFGGDIIVTYSDSSTKYLDETKVSFSGYNMNSIGEQTVTVSYTEGGVTKTADYTITVSKGSLSTISLNTNSCKTSFVVGETFSYAGLVVTANYDSGYSETVTPTSVSSPNMSTTGNKTITVTYSDKSSTYSITVSNDTVTSIEVSGAETNFTVGDTFTHNNAIVTAHYQSGNSSDVSNSATFSTPNMSTAGNKTVTVTYGGQSTSYSITVSEAGSQNPTIIVPGEGGTVTYSKATSISAGDKVVFVCETTNSEMNGVSSYGTYITYTSNPTGVYLLDVEAGSSNGSYAFKNGNNYISWASGNSLSTSTTKDSGSSWTVSFSSGNAIINNVGTSARQIWWNKSSPRFAAYAVNQAGNSYYNIQLYKQIKTGGQDVEVEVTSITATCNVSSYHPGETPVIGDFTVTANYQGGSTVITENISVNGTKLTYADAPSGGTNANKSLTVSFAKTGYKFLTDDVDVVVNRNAPGANATETLDYSNCFSQMIAAGYQTVVAEGETVTTNGVDYFIYNAYKRESNSQISLSYETSNQSRTTSGYVQNIDPLSKPISKVTVSSSITMDVEYSVDGSNFVTSKESNVDYHYFKVSRKSNFTTSQYANITSITIEYDAPESSINNLTNYVMFEDTPGQCNSKTGIAIEIFDGLSYSDKGAFLYTSEDYCVLQARERFNNWLKAKGKTVVYENNDYVIKSNRYFGIFDIANKEEITTLSTVIIVGAILITAVGSFIIIKKRKAR